jgi:phosphoribosylformimino-5-aminoimidazole carboxamide ribotide isomerase
MKIYPAIDILGGKAVRLKQGRASEATVYGDPLEMATKWISKGAEWLHVVDLDGAFQGKPKNLDLLRDMAAAVPLAKIQVGGGVRSMSVVESLLDAGIQRVVLGTAAVQDPDFVKHALIERKHNIAIGIDARDGNVHVAGWTEDSHIAAVDLAKKLQDLGARLFIYTDIARDGVLEGPNVEATKELLEGTDVSVIASGGVASLMDLRRLADLDHWRLDGVIIGKALYEGRIQIEEALAYAR